MKKIIAATDFSPTALNAAIYAADMAMAIKAELVLLHIYSIPVSYGEMILLPDLDEMRREAEKLIEETRQYLQTRSGDKLGIRTIVRMGAFMDELENTCEVNRPLYVIMGAQGTTAAERVLLGSHAVQAMKHLKWPLITVPVGAKFENLKKIGIACDLDQVKENIPVEQIESLAALFGTEVHILNIGKKDRFVPGSVMEAGILGELLEPLTPTFHFIGAEHVADTIMEFGINNQLDLLITLPRKHSWIEQLLHKSQSKQMILHSPVPVMVLHGS